MSILIVGFGPAPGSPANPSQEIVETIRAERWSPPGLSTTVLVSPASWWRAPDLVLSAAARLKPLVLLLIGHSEGADGLLVAQAAQNAAGVAPDVDGLRWPGREIAPAGPAALQASLPARAMARIIAAGDTPARTTPDGGDFIWNRCFYMALEQACAPRTGLILAPTPLETARSLGLDGPVSLNRGQMLAGVKAGLRWAAALAGQTQAAV